MKCIGRTSIAKKCQQKSRYWFFPFCRHHRLQPLVFLLITIPTIIGVYVNFYKDIIEPIYSPKYEKETFDNVNIRTNYGFNKDSTYPGFGIYFVLSVNNLESKKRKFIFDCGNPELNRISLYLDKGNNLVYRILDSESEPHILKVPQSLITFKAGETMVVFLDYGYFEGKSYMRLLINDRQLMEKVFRFPISLPENLNIANMRLGSDFSGEFGGSFYISEIISWRMSFSDKKHQEILRDIIKGFDL